MTAFVSAPGHRIAEQLAFLREFRAYTTEGGPDALTVWYREGDRPARRTLSPQPGGVAVDGDVEVARRVLGIGARELPLEAELPSAPPAHRWLYRHYAGIRPVLFANAFEGIAWAVLGQQITVGLPIHLKAQVSGQWGARVAGDSGPVLL